MSAAADELLREPRIDIKVSRLEQRHGVPRARNFAASLATAELLFITDAHVRFTPGWDAMVLEQTRPRRVLAGAVRTRDLGGTATTTEFTEAICREIQT